MHKLLLRQLKGLPPTDTLPAPWRQFIERVDATYRDNDADRAMSERSMALASDELVAANVRLRQDLEDLRTAQEVKRTLSLLQSTLDSTADGILVVDLQGKVALANQRFAAMWKLPPEILETRDDAKLLERVLSQLADPDGFIASVRKLYAEPETEIFDHLEFTDGRIFERYSIPQRIDGRPVGRVFCFRDVTQRLTAEKALRFTSFSVDHAGESVFWLDASARVISMNETARASLGYTRAELPALTAFDLNPTVRPADWPRTWASLKERISITQETQHRRKDGTLFPVEVTAKYLQFDGREYACAFARDITARKQLEEQVLQSQKMDAVGRLAGGVAHDFNNLLTVITGHAELLLADFAAEDPRHDEIDEIRKAADRAARLTRQLLAFSRKQIMQPKVVELNAVVGDMDRMLRRLVREDVVLETVRGSSNSRVLIDPGQMEQVLMNLVVNARDAVNTGGRITVRTEDVELPEGPHVMLSVTDTGCGMDAETQSHLFEPFFTTKEKGKGTGLGLSTVYGIVTQSGGRIAVRSEPGKGTTMQVLLPRSKGEIEGRGTRARSKPRAGTETILLAEDESTVRSLLQSTLERVGYHVLTAENGREALALLERHAGPIHLLLTDVVMPTMNGMDLAKSMPKSRTETRVLFMSGYTDLPVGSEGQFFQKPFTPEALLRKVREQLEA